MFALEFTDQAKLDIARLQRSEPAAYDKVDRLLEELVFHPYEGTGKPERLRYTGGNMWSRRITQKHRLLYRVEDERITVIVISAMGHYEDR